MPYTNWTIQNSNIQGDLNITLERGRVYSDFVELHLFVYSSKWDKINISIQYRNENSEYWNNNAKIISTDSDYIIGNEIYGLNASVTGELNTIVWKFKDNYFREGDIPELKINVLPTIKQFSIANSISTLTNAYGDNKIDFISSTNKYKILGVDNYGRYIVTDGSSVKVVADFSNNSSSVLFTYEGVLNPLHACQIYSDNYIVCDTQNDRIIELNGDFSSVSKMHSVTYPVFADYSEEQETLLVTCNDPDIIYELSWAVNATPQIIWSSSVPLNNPSCSTYPEDNSDQIIICDTGDNRIITYDRLNNYYRVIDECYLNNNITGVDKSLLLNKPFRAYKLYNGNICVLEKEGLSIDFDLIESSSSSSSSSSIDSSSSSSSSVDSSSSSSSSEALGIGFMIIEDLINPFKVS